MVLEAFEILSTRVFPAFLTHYSSPFLFHNLKWLCHQFHQKRRPETSGGVFVKGLLSKLQMRSITHWREGDIENKWFGANFNLSSFPLPLLLQIAAIFRYSWDKVCVLSIHKHQHFIVMDLSWKRERHRKTWPNDSPFVPFIWFRSFPFLNPSF